MKYIIDEIKLYLFKKKTFLIILNLFFLMSNKFNNKIFNNKIKFNFFFLSNKLIFELNDFNFKNAYNENNTFVLTVSSVRYKKSFGSIWLSTRNDNKGKSNNIKNLLEKFIKTEIDWDVAILPE